MSLYRRIIDRTFGAPRREFGVSDSLATLKRLGFDPQSCVDVGAYHGEWTSMFKSLYPSAWVLMVEAQPSKKECLEQVAGRHQDVEVVIALLGPQDGVAVTFHEMDTGSSVLAEKSPLPRNTVQRTTQTLDVLLQDRVRPKIDLLKLDVQGYELAILQGATQTLSKTDVIVLEASLLPVNAGCPLIAEVIASVTSHGFHLYDIIGYTRRKDGVLWQTDLVFVRDNAPFQPGAELNADNWF